MDCKMVKAEMTLHSGAPGALRGNGENAAPIHGATGSKGGAGNRPRAARHKPAAPGARAVKRQRGDAEGGDAARGQHDAIGRHPLRKRYFFATAKKYS